MKKTILGIRIHDRAEHAGEVQNILTKYGCSIKTRIGLHEVNDNACSTDGIMILDTFGDKAKIIELENKLRNIVGLELQKMEFTN